MTSHHISVAMRPFSGVIYGVTNKSNASTFPTATLGGMGRDRYDHSPSSIVPCSVTLPSVASCMPLCVHSSASRVLWTLRKGNQFFVSARPGREGKSCMLKQTVRAYFYTLRILSPTVSSFCRQAPVLLRVAWFHSDAPFSPLATLAPPPYPSRPTGLPEFNRIVTEVSQICKQQMRDGSVPQSRVFVLEPAVL